MGTVSWDAERYERQPLPHERWGVGVIERSRLRAGDSLVDAGCGTGRDAEVALTRLLALVEEHGVARGPVTLLDADAAMIAAARQRFAGWPADIRPVVMQSNLVDPWPVAVPADVIISVAALHWIGDHAAVFRRAAAIGAEQARLQVDCGGAGNIAGIVQAAERGALAMPAWNFATVDDTVAALRAGGWTPREVWLQPDPLVLQDEGAFREFLATVMFHDATPAQVDDVAAACADRVVDYVRLNIDAVRS
jgi:trans-aconitate 2-methyltransferase